MFFYEMQRADDSSTGIAVRLCWEYEDMRVADPL